MVTTLPYGSWPSSISAEQLAVGGNRLGSPQWVGEQLWWTEALAAEGGRQTIVRTDADPLSAARTDDDAARPTQQTHPHTVTVLPAPFNARSRVHEYGGSSWIALPAGTPAATAPPEGARQDQGASGAPLVLFVNFTDQRVYAFVEGGTPQPISPVGPEVTSAGGPSLRWAQPTAVSLADGTVEMWWVCEEHLDGDDATGAPLVERSIAALPLDGSAAEDQRALRRVTPASRFVAHPQLSPDGTQLAWISWEHPQMPWDGTALHVGRVAGGIVVDDHVLDGGPEVSVLQPQWRRDGELIYLSDRSGWWNPWTVQTVETGTQTGQTGPQTDAQTRTQGGPAAIETPRQLLVDEQEYAGPLWQLGQRWVTLIDADHALCIHGTATDSLGVLDLRAGTVVPLELPHTSIAGVSLRQDGALAIHGASTTEFSAISVGPLVVSDGRWRVDRPGVVRSSRDDAPDPALLPAPEPITVQDDSGQEIHAVLYRPRQDGFAAPAGELPPFIAQVHGGPTGQAAVGLSLAIAYYTSRGIGVVDINYGGSTGFGRAYRDRLKGRWGVVDVADTVAVMEHLVAEGIADPRRLGIEGGSAGGWTTLACLTRTETFAAGVSSFGVADLVALAEDTHDFESRYLDGLVGPYPEAAEIYRERAPLNHVDSLSCPVLLLQGDEDPIVPPNQAEMFRDALAAKSIPHAYLLFAGEQHGFRKAENIITSFEASLSFYGQIFSFEPEGIPHLELSR
ncbi:prolyl oligopeptidase family serine peptidase [Nesterenkonia sp. AY15]|uniref:prolyl oligopeptidase family serine peptidase n=1 Tax=Nesterenkonia sp. AY15 TaxID=2901139 RepID=UPI001F4D2D18|nr:prolyl oligopeptidase family serine peptidase [Nesterenkonia sp. AY15]MCH8571674.1 prolyl oligopeptidase family serine peptidase [Nesterenkonia sp. AY15]